MTGEAKRVDVLAVMLEAAHELDPLGSGSLKALPHQKRIGRELDEARAAIADLIEAATDVERRAGPDREPRLREALNRIEGTP